MKKINRHAEKILAEEQAGFLTGRSTIEQLTNCRIIMEKHLEIYEIFIS